MNHNTALQDVLALINASRKPVFISWATVQQWPSGALDYLLKSKLLSPASHAQSIECNACEYQCFMDVLIQVNQENSTKRAFIVCDVPVMQSQMGRISVPLVQLQQWKTSLPHLARVIAQLLGFDNLGGNSPKSPSIQLGMLKSKNGRRWVSLVNQPLALDINGFKTPLNDLLYIDDGELVIDSVRINALLDSQPLNEHKAYAASTVRREKRKLETQSKYQGWQDKYESLKKEYPAKSKTWYSKKIAKLPIAQGASSETIRRYLK